MAKRKLKIVASTQGLNIGQEYDFSCNIGDTEITIPEITRKPLNIISVLPSWEEPRHVKLQNSHITLIARCIKAD